MFYFRQELNLKNRDGIFIFIKKEGDNLVFEQNKKPVFIAATEFTRSDAIEIWETVYLFGKTPIKRLKRNY